LTHARYRAVLYGVTAIHTSISTTNFFGAASANNNHNYNPVPALGSTATTTTHTTTTTSGSALGLAALLAPPPPQPPQTQPRNGAEPLRLTSHASSFDLMACFDDVLGADIDNLTELFLDAATADEASDSACDDGDDDGDDGTDDLLDLRGRIPRGFSFDLQGLVGGGGGLQVPTVPTARPVTPSPPLAPRASPSAGAGASGLDFGRDKYTYACPTLSKEVRERRSKVSARLKSWRSRNYRGNFVKRSSRLYMKVTYNENGQVVTRFPNRQRVANNRSRAGGMFTNKRTSLPSSKAKKAGGRKRSFDDALALDDGALDDALEAAAAAGLMLPYDNDDVSEGPAAKAAKLHHNSSLETPLFV